MMLGLGLKRIVEIRDERKPKSYMRISLIRDLTFMGCYAP